MVALFVVGAGIALLWSGIRYEIIYRSPGRLVSFAISGRSDLALCIPGIGATAFNAVAAASGVRKGLVGRVCGGPLCVIVLFFHPGTDRRLCRLGCFLRKRLFSDQGLEDLPGKLQSGCAR